MRWVYLRFWQQDAQSEELAEVSIVSLWKSASRLNVDRKHGVTTPIDRFRSPKPCLEHLRTDYDLIRML